MEIPPNKMAKTAAYKLESGITVWWGQMQRLSQTRAKTNVIVEENEAVAKGLDCFLPPDYDNIYLVIS